MGKPLPRRTFLRQATAAVLAGSGLAACGRRAATLGERWQALIDRPVTATAATFQAAGAPTLQIAARSRFYGYADGVHRDFTNYGWSWSVAAGTSLPLPANAQLLTADIRGTGNDDLLVCAPDSPECTWYSLTATGALTRRGTVRLPGVGTPLAGDFRGVGHADLARFDPQSGTVRMFEGNGQGAFLPGPTIHLGIHRGQLVAGDFDGDGRADLCSYGGNGPGQLTVLYGNGRGGFGAAVHSVWPGDDGTGLLLAAPFAQNRRADLALYGGSGYRQGFAFRLNRGDGTFGPRSDEMGTPAQTHLSAQFAASGRFPTAGRLGTSMPALLLWSNGLLQILQGQSAPAYNYSVCLMPVGSGYRLWYGGRWQTLDTNGQPRPGWDGDHVLSASSPDGVRWYRRLDAPEMYQGQELGQTGWWTHNYLQPQVVRVGGTYHMFWQAEINPGQVVDTGQIATAPADRIGLATSSDGRHWQRQTDRGVVVGIEDPGSAKLGDEEVLYVPNDPDHLPWWLYVFYIRNGAARGYLRLRSADPTTFQWSAREPVTGFSQLGNGCAYVDGAPGGRLYLRITFAPTSNGRTAPALQFSRDGLLWGFGQPVAPKTTTLPLWETATVPALLLATTANNRNNRNVYFLGLSSEDGTGRLLQAGAGVWRALYAATTSNGPTTPAIWHSLIGVGEFTLRLT